MGGLGWSELWHTLRSAACPGEREGVDPSAEKGNQGLAIIVVVGKVLRDGLIGHLEVEEVDMNIQTEALMVPSPRNTSTRK